MRHKSSSQFLRNAFLCFAAGGLLQACGNLETEAKYPTGYDRAITGEDIYAKPGSVLGGDGGLSIFSGLGGNKDKDGGGGSNSLAINSFLWRASLDTVSFMPLSSADPFGGVILTDWYTTPETPNERFKLNVFILSKDLRSDGVSVKVFSQNYYGGTWRDDVTAAETGRKIEDAILTRARQLRVSQLANK